MGKTHLIQAIGNALLEHEPAAKIRYIHAETYVSDVVRAYQHKAFDDFKRYYHSLDLLLIDDIQFFNNKNRTQEEFFYLFNTLIEAHKQVVITCDTYPKEIEGKVDHDKIKCRSHVRPVTEEYVKTHYGFDGYGCGLCQTGVPCESKIPLADEFQ